jgi:hypothetical protein
MPLLECEEAESDSSVNIPMDLTVGFVWVRWINLQWYCNKKKNAKSRSEYGGETQGLDRSYISSLCLSVQLIDYIQPCNKTALVKQVYVKLTDLASSFCYSIPAATPLSPAHTPVLPAPDPKFQFYFPCHANLFSYNSLYAMWESSQLSLLEIPLRTNVKGKIRFPQWLLSNQEKIYQLPL